MYFFCSFFPEISSFFGSGDLLSILIIIFPDFSFLSSSKTFKLELLISFIKDEPLKQLIFGLSLEMELL